MQKSTDSKVVQSATLIISGGGFDPRDITKRLRMQPSQAWRRGERKSYRGRDGVVQYFASVHGRSCWKKWLSDRASRMTIERQLIRWIAKLQPRVHLLRNLRRRGISIELNCCVISEGVTTRLPADLMAKIGKLGVDLEITWYAPSKKRSNLGLEPSRLLSVR